MKSGAVKAKKIKKPARASKRAPTADVQGAGHAVGRHEIAEPVFNLPIQRKAACACGGGCSACSSISSTPNISSPNDPAEIEADRIADRVMRMPVQTNKNRSRTAKYKESNRLDSQPSSVRRKNSEPKINRKKSVGTVRNSNRRPNNAPPHVRRVIDTGGVLLDSETRGFFEPRLGFDLGDIRVHVNDSASESAKSINAEAYTVGNDIVFGEGQFQPSTEPGRRLLAHELVHATQHFSNYGSSLFRRPAAPSYGTATGVENPTIVSVGPIKDFIIDLLTAPQSISTTISDPTAVHLTWVLYDPNDVLLDGFTTLPTSPTATSQPFVMGPNTFRRQPFVPGKHILRCTALNAAHEPTFYADREFNVFPDSAISFSLGNTAGLAADSSRPGIAAIPPAPVTAHFFPGTSSERALVIGGVHGAEQSGIEVVEALRALIANPSLPTPYFSIILIPALFPDNLAYDRAYRAANPRRQGTDLAPRTGGRYTRLGPTAADMREPNRNYPTPGTGLDTALHEDVTPGVLGRPTTPPQMTTVVNQTLLPETRMLLSLIQSFRPSRIASIHAHRPSTRVGDAPGIFVDPRANDPATAVDETAADDDLATRMLADARTRGLRRANPGNDIHYSAGHPTGASLGDWGPSPVDEGTAGVNDRAGDRQGITTITVEVENYSPSSEHASIAARVQIHSETLLEVFLARP